MRSIRCLTFVTALTALFASSAWAQDGEEGAEGEGLSRILQGLSWGATVQQALDHYRSQYLEEYLAEVAGLRDTMEIDAIRRRHDQRLERIEQSLETFDGTRTGYEVSVLSGEVAAMDNESMLTVRTDNAMLYYIFTSDQLYKLAVAYNSNYLGGLEFDSFLEQVERRYGPPTGTEMAETGTGSRYLARARWEDETTRLRVENRSNLFGTFIMVFTDPILEGTVTARRGGSGANAANEGVVVSPLVQGLSSEETGGAPTDIADRIIGSPTVVELVVPEAEPVEFARPEDASPMAAVGEGSGDVVAAEAEEEPSSGHGRNEEEEEEEEEETEEGITIY